MCVFVDTYARVCMPPLHTVHWQALSLHKQRLRVKVRVVDGVPCVHMNDGSFIALHQYLSTHVPALARVARAAGGATVTASATASATAAQAASGHVASTASVAPGSGSGSGGGGGGGGNDNRGTNGSATGMRHANGHATGGVGSGGGAHHGATGPPPSRGEGAQRNGRSG